MTVAMRRPTADPDLSYDPMGYMPTEVDCGSNVADSYWTRGGEMSCCLLHEAWAEYRAEIPEAIHVTVVPTDATSIPLSLSDPDGPSEAVFDAGAGRPFAISFTRWAGWRFMEGGESVLSDTDTRIYPVKWAINGPLRRKCRAKHNRDVDHTTRALPDPLCAIIVRATVVRGYRPARVAQALRMTPERLEEHLGRALRDMWRWRSDLLNELEEGLRKPRAVVA